MMEVRLWRNGRIGLAAGVMAACGGDGPSPPTVGGLNLRPAAVYVVQAVQTQPGEVPLVAARAALLRVFVTASESTTVSPQVRIRLFSGSAEVLNKVVSASAAGVPREISEGDLARSWNLVVPAELMQPGLAAAVEVDPSNSVVETSETDNTWPAAGRTVLDVRAVPNAHVMVVPVITGGIEGPPRVTPASGLVITDLARKLFPFPALRTTVHADYTTRAFEDNVEPFNAWSQLLQELAALRTAEGVGAEYLGIVRLETNPELLGLASRAHVGISHDDLASDADTVAAHELGHVFGLRHANCGGAGGPDFMYPYPQGATGAYGLDFDRMRVMPPTRKDVMGYCPGAWISDYHFRKVMTNQLVAAQSAMQPAVIVWGGISNGRITLRPAFRAVTRASLPAGSGEYHIRALDAAGMERFALSFAGDPVEDVSGDERIFAFAVPADAHVAISEWRTRRGAGPEERWPGTASATVVRDPLTREIVHISVGRGNPGTTGR